MTPSPRLLLAVAAGGAAGAATRHLLGLWMPDAGFPWTTFGINVVGSFLLALLPALAFVRASPAWTAALGPGLLGGFTTLSAYAEQARALLADERVLAAGSYVVGTLAACVLAALLAGHLTSLDDRDAVAARGGDQ